MNASVDFAAEDADYRSERTVSAERELMSGVVRRGWRDRALHDSDGLLQSRSKMRKLVARA